MNLNLFNRYIGEGGASRPASEHPDMTHWRRVCRAALKRDGRCRACGSSEELETHHITYERFGAELVDDVTTLCRCCHGIIHAMVRARRRMMLMNQRRVQQEKAGQLKLEVVA